MRRAAKRDRNHAEIVKALRDVGCKVVDLAAVGNGCPDLLVLRPANGYIRFLEVKDGQKPPSERRLTPDQVKFHAEWGHGIEVVHSVDEAFRAMGLG